MKKLKTYFTPQSIIQQLFPILSLYGNPPFKTSKNEIQQNIRIHCATPSRRGKVR